MYMGYGVNKTKINKATTENGGICLNYLRRRWMPEGGKGYIYSL